MSKLIGYWVYVGTGDALPLCGPCKTLAEQDATVLSTEVNDQPGWCLACERETGVWKPITK